MNIKQIATFHSPLKSKFGIPKQSGIAKNLMGYITLEPAYRNSDAIRGIEGFDYLWLIWQFSANKHAANSLLVRPPRLGGNEKVGVFASRSPFRPNSLGLSSVRIHHIDYDTKDAPRIYVSGADLMDGTPIFDIKPYITYADSHQDARSGFVDHKQWHKLKVELSDDIEKSLRQQRTFTDTDIESLKEVLAEDPRPQYQNDPERIYGMPFKNEDIHFKVVNDTVIVLLL